jgi:hypothetical protein
MNIYLESGLWIRVVDNRQGEYSEEFEKAILNKDTDYKLLQHPSLFHGGGPDTGLMSIDADCLPVVGNFIYEVKDHEVKTKVKSFGSPIKRVEGKIEELD